jgi:uncharacterized membrane protein
MLGGFVLSGGQMAHKRGGSTMQAAPFSVMRDDLVAPDAVVRVVDAWIGSRVLLPGRHRLFTSPDLMN